MFIDLICQISLIIPASLGLIKSINISLEVNYFTSCYFRLIAFKILRKIQFLTSSPSAKKCLHAKMARINDNSDLPSLF